MKRNKIILEFEEAMKEVLLKPMLKKAKYQNKKSMQKN